MSIEQTLERIAVALEKQIALTEGLICGKIDKAPANQSAPTPPTAPKKEKGAPKAAPVVAAEPVPVENDPFSDQEPVKAEPVLNFDVMKDVLTRHAKAIGTKTTLALMVKHGADSQTPKVASIPEANYQACYNEVIADLKKVEKK